MDLRSRGLSLVELLVALGITALLLLVSVPGLGRLRAEWVVRGTASQVLAGLHLARRTALATGQSVTLCPSPDGRSCGFPARNWILFANLPGGTDARRETSETVLRQWQMPPRVHSAATRGYAAFQPQTSAASTVTFIFCHLGHAPARREVIVSQTGRPRISPGRPSTSGATSCP